MCSDFLAENTRRAAALKTDCMCMKGPHLHTDEDINSRQKRYQPKTRQSQTADSAPGVTLSARKEVPCVRYPSTGITAHSL